ncbi:hypothetical protein U9M48_012660 [Paspalum notatum var. saurae]|uniref:non-specific serine/threonine protein kinase n=1 Tax=Paspalum notatum var. saurae TaxID=547442 RepID=A0AAQ3SYP6_PASNO
MQQKPNCQGAMGATIIRTRSLVLLCTCVFFVLSVHVRRASSSLSFRLNFSDPGSGPFCGVEVNCVNVNTSGGLLELTRKDAAKGIIDSIGRATYAQPVQLWEEAAVAGGTKLLASFTTSFTFRITPDPSQRNTGDGMAFFLTPYASAAMIPPYSGGGGLGLGIGINNWTGDSLFRFVAVEFDTWFNGPPADFSSNHMGIDNSSIVSIAYTNTSSPTGNLTSDLDMYATINYHNHSKLLTADLQINGSWYHVNTTIDLSSVLPEEVAVGFSAATGLSAELHRVLTWSFNSTLAAKVASPPTTTTTTDTGDELQKIRLLLGVLVPLLFLSLCAAAGGYLLVRQRRRSTPQAHEAGDSSEEELERAAELERGVAAGGPRRYTYRQLAAATNNFAEEKKLGRGGFGSVYLGHLLTVVGGNQQDRPVAIKVFSSESSTQGRKEFEAEVRIISRLKHRHLVQLLGWCDSRSGLMLVYELVAQGSLDRHLYSRRGDDDMVDRPLLTWPQRYQIIIGLGSALRYLHEDWEQCVVHGDIKPSNIMLDESLAAKLGDFGLARLVDHGAGWQTTKAVCGTAGYIDPEFVNKRRPSTCSDVYSFGIVLLELVSGRPPVWWDGDQDVMLLKWVWSLYGRNAILDAADERLRGDEVYEQCMERALVVGLWCAHPDQSERPSIGHAMHVLHSDDKRLLPELPMQLYKTAAPEYGALSVESSSNSCVRLSGPRQHCHL